MIRAFLALAYLTVLFGAVFFGVPAVLGQIAKGLLS